MSYCTAGILPDEGYKKGRAYDRATIKDGVLPACLTLFYMPDETKDEPADETA
ncbi:hypothetical protein [Jiulongibacter sp. NS-SX5]|uniref:hypothetical protein n=1 Tax=Jiulongibacter sp. NS-SX5 TaxID=3463854 RepID=UPI004058841D